MAGVPQKTLNWLYDVLKREYRDPNRTYSDLAHVLARYSGLAPRTDVYTFEDGLSALLLHFKGTILVDFRGTMYRFPISIFIPHVYPFEPPICYVAPAEDMAIRPGQHVGGDGKIYHPYLSHWRESWERSNLVGFLSILSEIFAKEPPVVARPPHQQQQQQHHRTSAPPPPPPPPLQAPPPPWEHQQTGPPPTRVSGPPAREDPTPPPPPPKPHAPSLSSPPSAPTAPARPGRYEGPPPLPPPPQDPKGYQHPPGDGGVRRMGSGSAYMPQRGSGLRQTSLPPLPLPQSLEQQHMPRSGPVATPAPHQYPPTDARSTRFAAQVPQRAEPPPQSYHTPQRPSFPETTVAPPSYHGQPLPLQHQGSTLQPPAPPVMPPPAPTPNLLDSPFDIPLPAPTTSATHGDSGIPAPPIPLNPEKEALLSHLSHQITQSLHSQIAQSSSAMPALSSQNAALQSTLQTLSTELQELQTLQSTLTSNLSLLSSSLAKSDAVISDARSRSARNDIPSVDEMLVPPTVVACQLYDTACEERGIEIAILALQEGFVRGRVGGEVWSRRTRELAREGFKRRWMERKIGRGMGLDLRDYAS